MPALSGALVATLYNEIGAPIFVIYEFWDPATGNLRNAAQATSAGSRTGALIVDNMTGKTQSVTVSNPETGTVKTFSIPSSGRVLTVAQLAALPAPDGPIMTIQDLAGISPSLTL